MRNFSEEIKFFVYIFFGFIMLYFQNIIYKPSDILL